MFLEKRHPKTLALSTHTHTRARTHARTRTHAHTVQATDISDKLHPVGLCDVTDAARMYATCSLEPICNAFCSGLCDFSVNLLSVSLASVYHGGTRGVFGELFY